MIFSIQYLRAIAALMVVAHHAAGKVAPNENVAALAALGAAGVDIFFVISGFVMRWTTTGNSDGPAAFLLRRMIRIVPLYWLLTTTVIVIAACAPSLANITTLKAQHILASYLFVPWPHPGWPSKLWPVLVPGWTLNYEMFFYALVAACLAFPKRFQLLLLATVIATLVVAGLVMPIEGTMKFYFSPLLIEFLAGFVLADIYRRFDMPTWAGFIVVVLAICSAMAFGLVIDPNDYQRVLVWGLPAFAMVSGALFLGKGRQQRLPWLARIGNASYSIYLIQFLAIPAVALAWKHLGFPNNGAWAIGFLATSLMVVTASGFAIYTFLETPMLTALKRRVRRSPRPQASVVVHSA